jgi:3-dehydroquinate dehydratase-1
MSALRVPPLVVGTARPTSLGTWADLPLSDRVADVIEARLDLAVGEPTAAAAPGAAAPLPDLTVFLPACQRLERTGSPILLTVRLVPDGGRWTDDRARLPLFERALAEDACSWVDVEVESAIAADVVGLAHARGARVVVSHHDFSGTPDVATLEAIVDRGWRLGADLVKVATCVEGLRDHDHLIELLRRRRDQALAVIGMGPFGTALRTYLPCVGSRLTYGFLDDVAAPGQLPARDLVARLLTDCPAYAQHRQRPAK